MDGLTICTAGVPESATNLGREVDEPEKVGLFFQNGRDEYRLTLGERSDRIVLSKNFGLWGNITFHQDRTLLSPKLAAHLKNQTKDEGFEAFARAAKKMN
jgi:hypothetical protein